jgi:hypothetical protein
MIERIIAPSIVYEERGGLDPGLLIKLNQLVPT